MRTVSVLLRIEAVKAVKRRAFWVTAGMFAVFNMLLTVNTVGVAIQNPNMSFALPRAWPQILQMPANLGPFFLGVLVVLLVTPEFSWRTGRQNVIDGLSKERFYGGKLLVLAAVMLLLLVLPLLIGAIGTMAAPGESGPTLVRPGDFNYMIGYGLILLMWGSAALMLACLLRSTGPAMGILLVYMLIEGFVGNMLADASRTLERAVQHLPFAVYDALADPLRHYPALLARENAIRAEQGRELVEFLDLEVLIIAAVGYAAIFVVTGFLSIRRRDL